MNGPTTIYPLRDLRRLLSIFPCPLRNALRFTLVCPEPISASIVALLFSSRPTAVVWRVWAIVVGIAVQAQMLRYITVWKAKHNPSEKPRKPKPFLANINSASPIVIVKSKLRISASLNHRVPNMVNPCAEEAVYSSAIAYPFSSVAATAGCAPFQVTGKDGFRYATIANAFPHPFAKIANYDKPSETFISEVFQLSGKFFKVGLSHSYLHTGTWLEPSVSVSSLPARLL